LGIEKVFKRLRKRLINKRQIQWFKNKIFAITGISLAPKGIISIEFRGIISFSSVRCRDLSLIG
jgi:hypothetical protein